MCEYGFDLGGEYQSSIGNGVIKRFDSHAIPDKDQLSPAGVPQPDGEESFEFVDEIEAALFVEMKDCFGVGSGPVRVAEFEQALAQGLMVVDFTVECDPDPSVLVGHWIAARLGQVDDGEPPMAEAEPAVTSDIDTGIVRPPVSHFVAHPGNQRAGHARFRRSPLINAANPTHC